MSLLPSPPSPDFLSSSLLSFSSPQDLSADFSPPKAIGSRKGGYMRSKSAHRPPPVSNCLSETQFLHLQERLNVYKVRCNKLQCEVARLSGERDMIKQSFDDIIKVLRWLKKINKNGTTDEFKLYFNGLSPAQQKQYQTEADDLISASSWNKASDSAVVDGALH
ncbi:hypothetical protein P692DRAFT_20821376 [Suillus brevipes Sb2]|nr:hypothetical protein P692DRAFT_20821376 [Suillus brevipes Sb2]